MAKKRLSEFYKNVLTLVMGAGLAQAVNLLAAPVLSRLFTPEEFALFIIFTSITSIAGVAATGRYEMAVPLPADPRRALHVAAAALLAVGGTTLLVLAGVIATHLWWIFSDHAQHFPYSFYLLPVAVMAMAAGAVFNYWSTRVKTFRMNAIARVLGAVITVGISIVAGWMAFGTKGLIIGFTLGHVATMIFLWYNTMRNFRRSDISRDELRDAAGEYKNFPLVNMPHALIDSLQDNGIVFLLNHYFNAAVTGGYGFAFRMLKAPVGLVGAAFGQVFYQQLSEAFQQGKDMRPMVLRIYIRLLLIAFPGFLILFLWTADIFAFVFGENWRQAGEIAHLLTPWIFLNFIASPVANIALVTGKQTQAFLITLLDISVRFSALIIGGVKKDYALAFTIISVACSIILIFALVWFYSLARPARTNEK